MTWMVYALGFGNRVKVGISTDIEQRVRAIQNGCPDLIEVFHCAEVSREQAETVEKMCHAALHEHRLRGEWFAVDPREAVAVIAAAVANEAVDRHCSISPAQCRAARGILAWTQRELAEAAQVAERTVARFEGSEAERRAGLAPRALRAAFERHGVGFAECHGVYWRPAKR